MPTRAFGHLFSRRGAVRNGDGTAGVEGKSQHSIASAILEKEPAAISITKPLAPRSLDHIIPPLSVKRPPKIQATLSEFSMAELSAFRLLWSSPER